MQDEPGKCSICEMPLEKIPEQRSRQETRASEGTPDTTDDKTPDGVTVEEEMNAASGAGVLAIPVSAVLDTGRRRITYRQTDEGAYELVELKLGPRAHSMDESGKRREFFVVLDDISEGDRVVSQGGFLLDSQRQIEGMPSLLYPKGQADTALHSEHGGRNPSSSTKEKSQVHQH